MSITSINKPHHPTTGVQRTTDPAQATTGNYDNKVVNLNAGKNKDNTGRINQNIPRFRLRNRRARTPSSGEHRRLFCIPLPFVRSRHDRRPQISSPQISSPDSVSRPEAARKLTEGSADILIDIAANGLAVAKSKIVEGLHSEKSSQEVASFLESGDKGIRRAMTPFQNLISFVSFDRLTAAEKKRLPKHALPTLKQQSTQIIEMAKTVSEATFLDGTHNFTHCGNTSENSYTEMMKKHPEQDLAMRNWIRTGINLGSEITAAQKKVLINGEVLSHEELSDLQLRANQFAATAIEPQESAQSSAEENDSDSIQSSVIGNFTEEVLEAFEQRNTGEKKETEV